MKKKFVLNYKEHILGTSIFYNSLNKTPDLESIEIKFSKKTKSRFYELLNLENLGISECIKIQNENFNKMIIE